VTELKGSTALNKLQTEPSAPPVDSPSPKSSPHDVGAALRNAFQATVEEAIPSEMLDLLRRLD
jgi:hypothetical protein